MLLYFYAFHEAIWNVIMFKRVTAVKIISQRRDRKKYRTKEKMSLGYHSINTLSDIKIYC